MFSCYHIDMFMTDQEKFMKAAILQAKKAGTLKEAPIGCVIVHEGRIISRGYNRREIDQDVTLHAEMIAIRKACRVLGSWRLEDCDLYVTLEPCYMCAATMIQARIRHVYFGADDLKGGAVVSKNTLFDLSHNHRITYTGGILKEACSSILSDFFRELREEKKRHRESTK